jgi:hypothetical protein
MIRSLSNGVTMGNGYGYWILGKWNLYWSVSGLATESFQIRNPLVILKIFITDFLIANI